MSYYVIYVTGMVFEHRYKMVHVNMTLIAFLRDFNICYNFSFRGNSLNSSQVAYKKTTKQLLITLFLLPYKSSQIFRDTVQLCVKNKLASVRRFLACSLFLLQIVGYDTTVPLCSMSCTGMDHGFKISQVRRARGPKRWSFTTSPVSRIIF